MVTSMIGTLIDILSAGGTGAIVGLVGSIAVKWLDLKVLREKLTVEVKMAEIRTRELELEQAHALALADKEIDKAEVEGKIALDVAEMNAFAESQKEASVRYGGFVDQIRGLMRPIITVFLLAASTWILYRVWQMVGGLESLNERELLDLFRDQINAMSFLTMTAVTWWFGSRPSHKNSPQ